MADVNVSVMCASTVTSDAELSPVIWAIQEDLNQNGHLWNLGQINLNHIPQGDAPLAGAWQLVFLDDSDQAAALGYHDQTAEGLPLGKVFVRTIQSYRSSVSRVASHEMWEMAVDPHMNRYTPVLSDRRRYIVEVGDLLSLDSQTRLDSSGVVLSGIALPAAYYPGYGTRYDIGGMLTAPLPSVQPSYGAYLMWEGGAGWECHVPPCADHLAFLAMRPEIGSRRHRRMMGPQHWRRSTVRVR